MPRYSSQRTIPRWRTPAACRLCRSSLRRAAQAASSLGHANTAPHRGCRSLARSPARLLHDFRACVGAGAASGVGRAARRRDRRSPRGAATRPECEADRLGCEPGDFRRVANGFGTTARCRLPGGAHEDARGEPAGLALTRSGRCRTARGRVIGGPAGSAQDCKARQAGMRYTS